MNTIRCPEEQARRICAALNACEGIPVEALENGYVKALEEINKKLERCAGLQVYDVDVIIEARRVQAMREGKPDA